MAKFCGNCGSALNDTAVFCGGCGAKVPDCIACGICTDTGGLGAGTLVL